LRARSSSFGVSTTDTFKRVQRGIYQGLILGASTELCEVVRHRLLIPNGLWDWARMNLVRKAFRSYHDLVRMKALLTDEISPYEEPSMLFGLFVDW